MQKFVRKMYHKTRDDTIQYNTTILERKKERKKEMAGDSAKKIVQRNGRKLKFLRGLVFSSFLQHALVRIAYSRYYLNGETIIRCGCGTRCFGASRATGAIEACRNTLNRRETHTRKEMIDPGHDLSEPGVTQYYFDTIYVTCASMWLSSFWSDRFWYVTWVIRRTARARRVRIRRTVREKFFEE